MKIIINLFGVFTLIITSQSQAALISVQASADMSNSYGSSLVTTLLPIGTTVYSDVQFDIGAGLYSTDFEFTNVSGTFTWDDTVHGLQTFTANNASIITTHSSGWFSLRFTGIHPSATGVYADSFSLVFDIGENPYTSTAELYDLVLNSNVSRMRVGATTGSGAVDYGELEVNVSSAISAVPIPAAFWLFGFGLISLIGVARR